MASIVWEVLNGVGVDGVGVIFPLFFAHFSSFFTHFSAFSTHFSSFSTHFSPFSPEGQGQTTAIYCKNGEFHSDPVCTDPVQNFPNCRGLRKSSKDRERKISPKLPPRSSGASGGPFTGVQVLRSKRLVLLHEKRVRRAAKMKSNCAPLCAAP